MITHREALERLREGNRRFASGDRRGPERCSPTRREELVAHQTPFAVILGCSDSRVPPEIVFDQGLGDLFVVRVAGNIATPSQIDSIEYAVEHLGARLVVVLGHSRCGAVMATLEEITKPTKHGSKNLRSIIEHIRPSVEPLMAPESGQERDTLLQRAIRANIHAVVDHLRHGSDVLKPLVEQRELLVVGAECSLETGVVEFLDHESESG